MDPAAQAARAARDGRSEARGRNAQEQRGVPAALLWAGFAVALSPVLVDLAAHAAESPWARYAALFPLLFGVVAWRERAHPLPRHRDGLLWIAAGFAIALIAIFSGGVRYGRPGAVLAAVGLSRLYGLASWRTQGLLPFCVPLPTVAARLASPELPASLLTAAAAVSGVFGIDVSVQSTLATTAAGAFPLDRYDAGLSLAALSGGLAWYAGLRWQASPLAAALGVVGAAALALPLQTGFIAAALLLASRGAPDAAQSFLDHAPWISTAALALTAIEWRARRGAPPRAAPPGTEARR